MSTDNVAYANDKIATPEVREQTRTSAQAMARDNQRGATTIARSGEPPSELHAEPIFSSHKAPETRAHASTGDIPALPGSMPHEFALHGDDTSGKSDSPAVSHDPHGATSDAGASAWRSGALIPGDVNPGDVNKNVSLDGVQSGGVSTGSDKTGAITPGNGDKIGAITPGNGDKIGAGTPGNGDIIGAGTPGNGDQIGAGTPGDGFDSLLSKLGSSDQQFSSLPNETGPYTVATDVTQIGSLTLLGDTNGSDHLSGSLSN